MSVLKPLLSLSLACTLNLLFAQEFVPDVLPPSPEAASLGEYTDIPAGTYTGIPGIGIPLYQVQYRDVVIPINFTYHASGIKVEEEATCTGLGWSLGVGGVISRSVRVIDDFANETNRKGFLYEGAIPQDTSLTQTILDEFSDGTRDGQSDVFYYSFPGHSGKFVLENGLPLEAHLMSTDKLKIEYDFTQQKWTVWSANGYKFVFGTKEYVRSLSSSISNPNNVPSELSWNGASVEFESDKDIITSWYLDSIFTPLGETFSFEYEGAYDGSGFKYGTRSVVAVSEKLYWGQGCGSVRNYTASQSIVHNIYLKRINYKNGEINFKFSDREDMVVYDLPFGSKVYDKPQKLDSIIIENNNGPVTKYAFHYSYFNSGSNYEGKRLKLDSLQETSGSLSNPPFKFAYNESVALPGKNSYARDYWGFYNAATGNATVNGGKPSLVPTIKYGSTTIQGADRTADEVSSKAGLLSRITYPTGGHTAYTFESNDYLNAQGELEKGGGLRIREIRSHNAIDAELDNIVVYDYKYQDGKLRGFSSGVLMDIPKMIFDRNTDPWNESLGGWVNCVDVIACSYSNTPLGNAAQGATVGYNQVTRLLGQYGQYGRSTFHYINTPDIPGDPPLLNGPSRDHSAGNGLLHKIEQFDLNGFKVREVNNQYDHVTKPDSVRSICVNELGGALFYEFFYDRSEWWRLTGSEEKVFDTSDSTNQKSVHSETDYFYENDTHYQLTKTSTWDSKGNEITTQIFYPDDLTALAPPEMWDENNPNYQHIHTPLIERRVFRNSELVSAVRVNYAYDATRDIVIRDYVETSFKGGPFEQVVDFEEYDDAGNIVQFTGLDGITVSYLWSYDFSIPIAEVTNATYEDIKNAFTPTELQQIQDGVLNNTDLLAKLDQLRNALPNANVVSFIYEPYVGVVSIKDAKGILREYGYDTLQRLQWVKDHQGNKLVEYEYKFQTGN